MLKKSIENMKVINRKLQSEYDSLLKAHNHSNALILNLDEEKLGLQAELEKHVKDYMSGILTNIASVEKNKVMHKLSEAELQNLVKINQADIKSEFVQTVTSGILSVL